MRLSFVIIASCVFAAACGKIEVDPDASENTIDAPDTVLDAPSIDTPIVVVDAAIDAQAIDAAPPTAPFDIAYTSRWTITNTTGVGASQIGLIINKSTSGQAMDLNTLQVISSTDDHPTAVFNFQILNAATYSLPAQQAGGLMVAANANLVNPLVTETRFNTSRPTFDYSLSTIPIANATINASAQVRHGNQVATLTWVFTIQASGTNGAQPTGASRVSSVFTP